MSSLYKLCLMAIKRGLTNGLVEKLDVYLLNDRITAEEYGKLLDMIKQNDAE